MLKYVNNVQLISGNLYFKQVNKPNGFLYFFLKVVVTNFKVWRCISVYSHLSYWNNIPKQIIQNTLFLYPSKKRKSDDKSNELCISYKVNSIQEKITCMCNIL